MIARTGVASLFDSFHDRRRRPRHTVTNCTLFDAIQRSLGDAVVMAFTRGQDNAGWQATDPNLDRPKVNRGHEAKKRYLRGGWPQDEVLGLGYRFFRLGVGLTTITVPA